MTLQLVKIQDSPMASATYYVMVDGVVIPGGSSGSEEEATALYEEIAAHPEYLTTRQQILQQTNI